MNYEDYRAAGGVDMVYFTIEEQELPTPPVAYWWRPVHYGGNLICWKLTEIVNKSDCGCK